MRIKHIGYDQFGPFCACVSITLPKENLVNLKAWCSSNYGESIEFFGSRWFLTIIDDRMPPGTGQSGLVWVALYLSNSNDIALFKMTWL